MENCENKMSVSSGDQQTSARSIQSAVMIKVEPELPDSDSHQISETNNYQFERFYHERNPNVPYDLLVPKVELTVGSDNDELSDQLHLRKYALESDQTKRYSDEHSSHSTGFELIHQKLELTMDTEDGTSSEPVFQINAFDNDTEQFAEDEQVPVKFELVPKSESVGNCESSEEQSQSQMKRNAEFKCSECSKSFGTITLLKRHFAIHTGEKPYKCTFCPLAFIERSKLKRHENVHTGETAYKCPSCPKTFNMKHNLKTHIQVHSDNRPRPHKCQVCQKAFVNTQSLKSHLVVHRSNKCHKCNECGRTFVRPESLENHHRNHSCVKLYECDLCSKTFRQLPAFKAHCRRTHGAKKPYSCSACEKTFVDSDKLKLHSYSHTNEVPYTCAVCGKGYSKKSLFDKHSLVHTGEKPHKCVLCPAEFKHARSLKLHIYQKHPEEEKS